MKLTEKKYDRSNHAALAPRRCGLLQSRSQNTVTEHAEIAEMLLLELFCKCFTV
jgi:hypothetical protein